MRENPNRSIAEAQFLKDQFNNLVEQVQADVLRYAERVTGSVDLANELYMITWWDVLGRFPNIRRKERIPFKVYFQRALRSNFFDYQKRSRRTLSLDTLGDVKDERAISMGETHDLNEDLYRALYGLDPPLRQVILLQSEGYKEKESAELMGISPAYFKELLAEARFLLQQEIFREELTDPKEAKQEEYVTIEEIAQRLHWTWTSTATQLTAYKDQARNEGGRTIMGRILFPVSILEQLQKIPEVTVPASDWLTITQLTQLLGVDYRWVVRRLFKLTFKGELRVGTFHRVAVHYPPQSLDELMIERDRVITPPNPEIEHTISDLAILTKRHPHWVEKRLIEHGIAPKYRRHFSGNIFAYYDHSVLVTLMNESLKYPLLGDYLTIPMLTKATGMDREWVIKKLHELGITGEQREHPAFHRRVYTSYPPSTLNNLISLAGDYKKAEDGWLTLTALETKVGKSSRWILKRLGEINVTTIMQRDSRGALRIHYPPAVLHELLQAKQMEEDRKHAKKWYE